MVGVSVLLGVGSLGATSAFASVKNVMKIGGAMYADGGLHPCAAAVAASKVDGSTAPQIAAAYGIDGLYRSGDQGAGVTVGIVAFGPIPTAAIATFDRCYGINSAMNIITVASASGATSTPAIPVLSGWASHLDEIETALDIETTSVLAPKATIDVYDDPTGVGAVDTTISMMVASGTPAVISDSYLGCESAATAALEAPIFQQAATNHQSVIAASGDTGASNCAAAADTLNVDDPASSPLVTAVGGTTMARTYPVRESAWNGSGGGISSVFAMPSFQSTAAASLHVVGAESSGAPCGAAAGLDCRQVPDVSALAGSNDSGIGALTVAVPGASGATEWNSAGGTSLAAPIWSAIIADLDSAPGCGSLGDVNPKLYAAASSQYASAFNDVGTARTAAGAVPTLSQGGSGVGGYAATRGYDLSTGLGSPRLFAPNGRGLAGAMCPGAGFTPNRNAA